MVAAVVVFVFTQQPPPMLVVALLVLPHRLELWNEDDLQFLWKAFWVLFVFLGHVFGYAIFRAWLALRGGAGRAPGRPAPQASPRARCSRATLSASSSESKSSLRRSSPVTCSIRSSR